MTESPYTADFFKTDLAHSYASAKRIVPLVLGILPVRSVLDVGCGRGDFLRAFLEAGVADITGLDGAHVPRDQLVIDESVFHAVDLAHGFDFGRRYDLVVSLEVAEHLPADSADAFVDSLVRHGSVILFSAAVPQQGGTGHLNERWPSYWATRFGRHGYKLYDLLRPMIWDDQQVAWWYRQNTLLFATDAAAAASPQLAAASRLPISMLNVVHPQLYLAQADLLRAITAQIRDLQGLLRQGTSFEVAHLADGRMTITPKRG
jgi:SAM-dependent methyltransferase